MREKWRPVSFGLVRDPFGHLRNLKVESKYTASSAGRIKRDGVVIANPGRKDRYQSIQVRHSKGVDIFGVHRLVALAFLPIPSNDFLVVNHKNLKRGDNRLENLEWATRSEDARHARRMHARIRPALMVALEDIKAGDVVWLDPQCGKIRRANPTETHA